MPKILKCCILGCHESSRNVMEEISFHRIPKDQVTRKQWIDFIRSKTNQSHVFSVHALVCSKHFEQDQFVERANGSRLLIKDAFPSIFPNERRDNFQSGWSDNDGDECGSPTSATIIDIVTSTCDQDNNDFVNIENAPVKLELSDNRVPRTRIDDPLNSCRFCLTTPASIQIDTSDTITDGEIATMYHTLTGIEFHVTEFYVPETICTTCRTKLKEAFDFREHLISMNSHWETIVKSEEAEETVERDTIEEIVTEPLELKSEIDISETDHNDNVGHRSESELIDQDENRYDERGEDENRRAQSVEDDKFIQSVEDFVKTVKPLKQSKLKKSQIPKPSGKLLTAKSAKLIAADQERLNLHSTWSPHSTQMLKRVNKWWRMMHDCNYCDAKDYITIEDMNKHLRLQHADLVKVTCDICKKVYSELKYLRKHMRYVHQTKQHECTICKKRFYYNYNLKSHMQHHNNEKTSICHFCGKFFSPTALHKHLKTCTHANQEKQRTGEITNKEQAAKYIRYYCHICVPAKRFNICSELTEHRRLFHNDFECPICRGWFSCSEALQNHLKTHSNKERKHACTLCASTFVRASHLEGHMRRKHSSNPKQISCDLCNYKCVESYELYGHKKHAHSNSKPYKCLHCEKSFSKEQAHKDHMLTSHDIGEYRYLCKECPKQFVNSAALIQHRGTHHNGVGNS
ncbi:Zinc finger protein [Pseudolycoriella hygida]|uniref:Zinc finger protein n=1 Tax=Pseudolycoriella hygida TaxID=35572 RepID=A0A9Q0S8M9_9DIPT|nr:Zinc finger protein [Pseudolycoriella hygida]